MQDNLKRFATEKGLDPSRAGEVLLAATEPGAGQIVEDLVLNHRLLALGIKGGDSRKEVTSKIALALTNVSGTIKEAFPDLAGSNEIDPETLRVAVDVDLKKILAWVVTE